MKFTIVIIYKTDNNIKCATSIIVHLKVKIIAKVKVIEAYVFSLIIIKCHTFFLILLGI